MRAPNFGLICLVGLGFSLDAAPARAVPIVYTLEGILALGGGTDDSGLDGASFTMTMSLDSEQPPDALLGGTTPTWEVSTEYTASNRPGGLPDIVNVHDSWFEAYNNFPPSPSGDAFGTEGTCLALVCTYGGIWVTLDQGVMPGTGIPTPPVWGSGDVLAIDAVFDDGDATYYVLTSATFTAIVVPEPAAALLLAWGIAGLAAPGLRRRSAIG